MKFFDREYAQGDLDSRACVQRQEAYRKHLEAIAAVVPHGLVNSLAGVKFHDARLEVVAIDSGRNEVVLEMLCVEWGSRSRVRLTYRDAVLKSKAIARKVVADERSELMYQELDVADSRCLQRFIFHPRYLEFEITFTELTCEIDRDLPSGEKPKRAMIRDL